jgi:hypothetical protein
MSRYRAPLWDLRPDIISCRNVAVWNLRSYICGAPSLTRGRICNLQCNQSMIREPVTIFYCLIWDSLNLEGHVIPLGTGFPLRRLLGLASYDSQGYGGGILTPLTWRDRSSQCQSQSHVTTYGQSISMSWCLVHSALKGVPSEKFQFHIRRCTLGRNCWCYHWEGCMRSMQCNVEFWYQHSLCSGTKGNHGKPWSSWPVAGPSECKLTSSQQSGIKYASPNTSPYLCFVFIFEKIYKLFLQKLYLYVILISTIPCITPVEGINAYRHKYAYNYTQIFMNVRSSKLLCNPSRCAVVLGVY